VSHKPGEVEAKKERDKSKLSHPGTPKSGPMENERPDFDDAELRSMQESELRRIFSLVSRNNPSECVSKSEFELLLLTLLGFELSAHSVEGCISELCMLAKSTGVRMVPTGRDTAIPFQLFLNWWTTTNSIHLLSRTGRK
jgi:hypothetical protein